MAYGKWPFELLEYILSYKKSMIIKSDLFIKVFKKFIYPVRCFEEEICSLAPEVLVKFCGGGGGRQKGPIDGAVDFQPKI